MEGIDPRWRDARRVLAVRLDNLGDVLVTSPALRAIKESLPQVSLTLLASPVGAQVGRLNPYVDDVIVYQAPWMDPWSQLPQDTGRERAMVETVAAGRFDGAIIFTSFRQSSLPAAYLCYMAGIPLRLAASIDGPGSLLTTRHKHPEHMMHEVERGLDLVGAIGLGADADDLVLKTPDDARVRLAQRLPSPPREPSPPTPLPTAGHPSPPTPLPVRGRGEQPSPLTHDDWTVGPRLGPTVQRALPAVLYGLAPDRPRPVPVQPTAGEGGRRGGLLVVVHPGCSMPARTYPWQMFGRVVDLLVERMGATVVVTGAADERELVERVRGCVQEPNRDRVLGMAGTLPFDEFCALIERADLTITNNTGPMHVSAAVKTPVVALFALTNPPEQWGPWRAPHRQLYHEVSCRICYKRACPYNHECLTLVSPEAVVEAARELLDESRRTPSLGNRSDADGVSDPPRVGRRRHDPRTEAPARPATDS